MDRNYTLKDILLEAGVREYYATPADKERSPSEKHKKDMEKLFNKQTSVFEKIGNSPLYKGLSIAAAVAILFGVAIAIKPIREPVAAFFGSLFNRNSVPEIIETGEVTEPAETEKDAGVTTAYETGAETTADEQTTENETTDPFKVPETAEEWIDYLFNYMVRSGYSKSEWDQLKSFGLTAFDRLVLKYEPEDKDSYANALISVFASEYLEEEIAANENLSKRFEFIGFPHEVKNSAAGWLAQ